MVGFLAYVICFMIYIILLLLIKFPTLEVILMCCSLMLQVSSEFNFYLNSGECDFLVNRLQNLGNKIIFLNHTSKL